MPSWSRFIDINFVAALENCMHSFIEHVLNVSEIIKCSDCNNIQPETKHLSNLWITTVTHRQNRLKLKCWPNPVGFIRPIILNVGTWTHSHSKHDSNNRRVSMLVTFGTTPWFLALHDVTRCKIRLWWKNNSTHFTSDSSFPAFIFTGKLYLTLRVDTAVPMWGLSWSNAESCRHSFPEIMTELIPGTCGTTSS